MSISCRFASASLIAAAALLASAASSTAFAYDDVPGPSFAYVDPLVAPAGPVYGYYAPVGPSVRIYGYAPARRRARVYGYAPFRPSARVYGYGPVYAAEPLSSELRGDRRPLGIYAPHEPTNLSPSRGYFLGIQRGSGGD
jgi:hypothetical protein